MRSKYSILFFNFLFWLYVGLGAWNYYQGKDWIGMLVVAVCSGMLAHTIKLGDENSRLKKQLKNRGE